MKLKETMSINSRVVVYFEGPMGVGKKDTYQKFYEELLENNFNVKHYDLSSDGGAYEQLENRLRLYSIVPRGDSVLVTLCYGSLFQSLVYLQMYGHNTQPYHNLDFEMERLWELEAKLIPDELIPTHIVFFNNPPEKKDPETWNHYKQELQAYEEVFKKDFVRDALAPHDVKLIRLKYLTVEERINPLFSILTKK